MNSDQVRDNIFCDFPQPQRRHYGEHAAMQQELGVNLYADAAPPLPVGTKGKEALQQVRTTNSSSSPCSVSCCHTLLKSGTHSLLLLSPSSSTTSWISRGRNLIPSRGVVGHCTERDGRTRGAYHYAPRADRLTVAQLLPSCVQRWRLTGKHN